MTTAKKGLANRGNVECHEGKQNKSRLKTSCRKVWALVTWNIRSVGGEEEDLAEELNKTKIDLLATETKKKGQGM